MKSSFLQLVAFLLAIFILQGCGDDPYSGNQELDFSDAPDPYNLSQADTSYTKEDGVEIYVIEEGHGSFEVIPRDQISLTFTARKESDGEIFNSSYRNGNVQPILLQNLTPVNKVVGNNSVSPQIEGYRQGLLGMKEGEKRVIIVPPSMGYTDSNPGVNGMDLRDETLRYDVQLVNIR